MDLAVLDEAARALAVARSAVALTGAGISVESGIPDFRSDNGLWRRYPPERYATLSAFMEDPERCWEMLRAVDALLASAQPNEGHRALASMEQERLIRGVLTQNIDGLHSRAGNRMVVEVHGSCLGLHCVRCKYRDAKASAPQRGVPRCPRCQAPLKPPVVLFEEGLPEHAISQAWRMAQGADLMLVVGCSLVVYPAAGLPAVAAQAGAKLVEVNPEPGAMRGHGALELAGPAGEVLPLLLERALELRPG